MNNAQRFCLEQECILFVAKQPGCWFQYLVLPHLFLSDVAFISLSSYEHLLNQLVDNLIVSTVRNQSTCLELTLKIDKTKVLKSCGTVA